MLLYLSLSFLGLTEGLPGLSSADAFSVQVAHIMFVFYLILASIVLINMLIALLSDTYQRVYVSDYYLRFRLDILSHRQHKPIINFN